MVAGVGMKDGDMAETAVAASDSDAVVYREDESTQEDADP